MQSFNHVLNCDIVEATFDSADHYNCHLREFNNSAVMLPISRFYKRVLGYHFGGYSTEVVC